MSKDHGKSSNNHKKSNLSRSEREDVRRREQREEELQLIKDQYLGKKRTKKSMVPPSQKFKFNFDWESTEDTSEDLKRTVFKESARFFPVWQRLHCRD